MLWCGTHAHIQEGMRATEQGNPQQSGINALEVQGPDIVGLNDMSHPHRCKQSYLVSQVHGR
jgi:hypothetical protein